MCRSVRCRTCGKTTWAGCGQHVGQVRARVPAGEWCSGHAAGDRAAGDRAEGDWAAGDRAASGLSGLLGRLFARP